MTRDQWLTVTVVFVVGFVTAVTSCLRPRPFASSHWPRPASPKAPAPAPAVQPPDPVAARDEPCPPMRVAQREGLPWAHGRRTAQAWRVVDDDGAQWCNVELRNRRGVVVRTRIIPRDRITDGTVRMPWMPRMPRMPQGGAQ